MSQATKTGDGKPTFAWDDPFQFEDQLQEDERMIRDVARKFARDALLPRVTKAYLNETIDRDVLREMGKLGLLGVTLPSEYGCAGANYVSYGLVAREIEAVDSGYRSTLSVQSSLVMYPIYAFGDTQLKQNICRGWLRARSSAVLASLSPTPAPIPAA